MDALYLFYLLYSFFHLKHIAKLTLIYIAISSVFINLVFITIYLLIQIAKQFSNYSLYKYFTGGR